MSSEPNHALMPSNCGSTVFALVLICVMLAGVWEISSVARRIDTASLPLHGSDWVEGRSMAALEKQLDHALLQRAEMIATANALRYLLLRGGGEQVRVGRDGWLFLTDELRYHSDAAAHLAARAELLHEADAALSQCGVALVVALVPDKARLYAEQVLGGYPAANLDRYRSALDALREREVDVVDLLTPLQQVARAGDAYYRSDTHWNQAGAAVAAQAIAQRVQERFPDLTHTGFVTTVMGPEAERPGDLIRLMGLESLPNVLRPPPDREAPRATARTETDSGDSLFGDSQIEVALVGTSYSLRANFHGELQQALQAEVLNNAKDGGGFLDAATAYLQDAAFSDSPPQVLIWEIPERFLGEALAREPGWLASVGLAAQ